MEKQQENPSKSKKPKHTHTKTQPSMEVVRQIRATWTERRGRRELEAGGQRRGEAKAQDGWEAPGVVGIEFSHSGGLDRRAVVWKWSDR